MCVHRAAPTVTGVRTTLTTCTVPDWASQWLNASACYATAAGQWCGVRAVSTEPTQVNANDGFCDPTFAQYRVSGWVPDVGDANAACCTFDANHTCKAPGKKKASHL